MNPHLFALLHFLVLLPSAIMALVVRFKLHRTPLLKYTPTQLFLLIVGSMFALLLSYELLFWALELLFG